MKLKSIWVCSILASTAAGYATAGSKSSVLVDPAMASPSPSPAPHAHKPSFAHEPSGLTLELVPTLIHSDGGADTLRFEIEARNHSDGEISTAVVYEIIDDRGNVIVPARIEGSRTIKRSASDVSTVTTPEGMSDGYYLARATGAWSGAETSGTTSGYLYFALRGGRLSIIDAGDWYQLSRVMEGVAQ